MSTEPAEIRIRDLWDARYRDPGGEYVIPGAFTTPGGGDTGGTTTVVEPKLFTVFPKSSSFTLNQDDARHWFVVTDGITVTLPAVGTLGDGFTCKILNRSGGNITIDGPGSTNVTLADGDIADLYEANSEQLVTTQTATGIADVFETPSPWDPLIFGNNFDLVHWWDATRGVQIDATTGLVTRWDEQVQPGKDGAFGTQTTVGKQPAWVNQDEIRFNGSSINLSVKTQTRAGYENRWYFMLFRVNWTATTTTAVDPFLLSMNGNTDAPGREIPRLRINHTLHTLETIWYSSKSGRHSVTVDVPGDDDTWHTLVARRNEDAIYASIDGAAEVTSACYPIAYLTSGSSPTGFIGGDTTTGVLNWGLDTLLQGQGHLTTDEVDALHGWGMWRRGAEADLDAASPYLLAAPTQTRSDVHAEPPDSYADGYRFSNYTWDDTVKGDALDLTGFTRTFHDHFTSLSTITDGLTGSGPNWWAPAHIDTSNAKFLKPGDSPVPDVYSILADGTTLQIKMGRAPGVTTGPIYSGHIQSVDAWANGNLFTVPSGGALYFEARMSLYGAADGSIPGWHAFWLYSQATFKDSAATKAEIDIMECYGASGATTTKQLHATAHNHPAYRPQPGNNFDGSGSARTPSKIVDVTQSPFNASGPLFGGGGNGVPGTFHTYGVRIDETWMTWYFDGVAVSRFATYKEALGPLFMLVSLQSQDLVSPVNTETYMWVDYVDAWVHT